MVLIHQLPQVIESDFAEHRADVVVLSQCQQDVQHIRATIATLGRQCHRQLEDPPTGPGPREAPQHELIAQAADAHDRRVQITAADTPLRQQFSAPASPRASQ